MLVKKPFLIRLHFVIMQFAAEHEDTVQLQMSWSLGHESEDIISR